MKEYSYYHVVRHFSDAWQDQFYVAMSWIDKQLYRIPVFLQVEVEFTSPRASPGVSAINYWWFPRLGIGRNYAAEKPNDLNSFRVWSVWISWLGLFAGAGICVKCKKETP